MTWSGNNLRHSSSITLSNYKYCLSFIRALPFETCESNVEFVLYIYRKIVSAAAKIGKGDRLYSTKLTK